MGHLGRPGRQLTPSQTGGLDPERLRRDLHEFPYGPEGPGRQIHDRWDRSRGRCEPHETLRDIPDPGEVASLPPVRERDAARFPPGREERGQKPPGVLARAVDAEEPRRDRPDGQGLRQLRDLERPRELRPAVERGGSRRGRLPKVAARRSVLQRRAGVDQPAAGPLRRRDLRDRPQQTSRERRVERLGEPLVRGRGRHAVTHEVEYHLRLRVRDDVVDVVVLQCGPAADLAGDAQSLEHLSRGVGVAHGQPEPRPEFCEPPGHRPADEPRGPRHEHATPRHLPAPRGPVRAVRCHGVARRSR